MKILVCGDRGWSDRLLIWSVLKDYAAVTDNLIIIHGNCRGADKLAQSVAEMLGLETRIYPANWKKYGRAAGPIRNKAMLDENPDLVIAFHDHMGESKGTKNMLDQAAERGIEWIHISHTSDDPEEWHWLESRKQRDIHIP